jgi:hypothetical protein
MNSRRFPTSCETYLYGGLTIVARRCQLDIIHYENVDSNNPDGISGDDLAVSRMRTVVWREAQICSRETESLGF